MGALLARSEHTDHNLGEDAKWWEKGLEYGDDVINIVDSIIGGGGGGGCAAKRQQIEQDISTYLTQEDMNRFTIGLRPRIQPTPESMAFFIAGEDDCKHRNTSAKHARFMRNVKALIAQRKAGNTSGLPANMGLSTGGIPDIVKYSGIALGVLGLGIAGYTGYQALTTK